jgi:hypothetical protein
MHTEAHRLKPILGESAVACHRSGFSVAGVSVQLSGRRPQDVALVRTLEPFRIGCQVSDLTIEVEWAEKFPAPAGERLFDSGSVWRLYEEDGGFQFDLNAPVLGKRPYKRLVVDLGFRHAVLTMNARYFADTPCAAVPLDYPLDELLIMHRLTQEKAIELHGSGIVRSNGVGNLFIGHSGAGKSTTTRLWTEREDVEVLSDDRIIVRQDEGMHAEAEKRTPLGGANAADGVGILRLRDRSASPIAHSAQDDRAEKQIPRSSRNDKGKMRMYGTPWHGEAMYASPNSAPLARIFVLEHGHGNVIKPLTPSQAVAELFARSFVPFHRHEYVDSALVFLEELANAVPVYRYAFEPDQRAVEKIRNFHD